VLRAVNLNLRSHLLANQFDSLQTCSSRAENTANDSTQPYDDAPRVGRRVSLQIKLSFAATKFVVCGKNQKCSGTPKSTRTATCTMGPDCMSYGDESEASNLGLSKGEVAAAGSILGNILGHL
jgi:hypothetical protein